MNTEGRDVVRALLLRFPVTVLFILFCLPDASFVKADRSINSSGLSLRIEDHLPCVHEEESIKLTCTFSRIFNVNKTAGWKIVWRSEGAIIDQNYSKISQNSTTITSILTVYVNWPKDKVFTCVAAHYEGPVMNASVTLNTMPQQIHIIGVRFIEGSEHKLVEIYWKQREELNYIYSLIYTIEEDDEEDIFDKLYVINHIECHERFNDAYRVPNTTGHICKASIKGTAFHTLMEYRVHVNTTRGRCQSAGPIKKFMLSYFGNDSGPNKYDQVLIPHPVSKFTVHVARQRVKLTWSNPDNIIKKRSYRLTYNCSEFEAKKEIRIGKTDLTLYRSDFPTYRPYALCAFCIQVFLEASDVPSEPICREARLHEEAPSTPPKITCNGNECVTTGDERFRNVTVTWSLPPRETWNGVLTHVRLTYRPEGNGSRYRSINERNITRRFTVLPRLALRKRYIVQAVLCNEEGCSGYGNAASFGYGNASSLSVSPKQPMPANKPDSHVAIVISLGIGIVLVVILGIFVWWVKQRVKEREAKRKPLPKLDETSEYDNVSSDRMEDKEYDDFGDVDLTEEGERNVGLESLEDTQGSTSC